MPQPHFEAFQLRFNRKQQPEAHKLELKPLPTVDGVSPVQLFLHGLKITRWIVVAEEQPDN